jgi:hypothetical protein
MPFENGLGVDICFLQIHAPVFQLFQGNWQSGDGATHEGAGAYDAKIAIEIPDLGLASHRGRTIESVQHVLISRSSCAPTIGQYPEANLPAPKDNIRHNIVAHTALVTPPGDWLTMLTIVGQA